MEIKENRTLFATNARDLVILNLIVFPYEMKPTKEIKKETMVVAWDDIKE